MTLNVRALSNLRLQALIAGFVVVSAASGLFIVQETARTVLRIDAEATAEGMATYLAANLPDIEAIAAGRAPTPESLAVLDSTKMLGPVFLYKIFAADGRLRFSSDARPGSGEHLDVHKPEAGEAARAGKTLVVSEHGDGASRPEFYSEAYVPVVLDDRIVAVIEVYIDQTAKRASFAESIAGGLAVLVAVIVLAAGLPAIAFYRRTRQMQSADDEAEFLAGHDTLTGLVNRPHLLALTDIWLESGRDVALCSIDLDRFAGVADSIGQANGDELLRQIADRLHSVLGPGPTIARIGGDEFAVARAGIRSDSDAESIARQVVAAFAAPFAVPGGQVSVSASVGVAVSAAGRRDAAGLLHDAATALHRAQAAGEGQSRLYRNEMDSEQRDRQALETLIGKALAEDRFAVHFQPVFRSADRRLIAFEALMRMSREDGSPVSPSRFIPIAEDMGLIGDIGEFVLRKACATAAEWPPEISVAVNLSPVQFEDGELVATVGAALRDAGLAPGRLELEITEGVLLRNTEPVLSQLRALKALGVSIAMDDFGIGYSSLSYLWKFPFDRLKIDASFVGALQHDKAGVAPILQAIISLGRSLRIEVTAEGVETEDQALFLDGLGCNSLQGFHLGRPAPASEIPVMILSDFKRMVAGLRVQIRTASEEQTSGRETG